MLEKERGLTNKGPDHHDEHTWGTWEDWSVQSKLFYWSRLQNIFFINLKKNVVNKFHKREESGELENVNLIPHSLALCNEMTANASKYMYLFGSYHRKPIGEFSSFQRTFTHWLRLCIFAVSFRCQTDKLTNKIHRSSRAMPKCS